MRQPAVVQKSVRRPLAPQKPAVTEGWKPGEVDTHSVSDDDPMVGLHHPHYTVVLVLYPIYLV